MILLKWSRVLAQVGIIVLIIVAAAVSVGFVLYQRKRLRDVSKGRKNVEEAARMLVTSAS